MTKAKAKAKTNKTLTHLDARGAARMVDVGGKPVTAREAVAESIVTMAAATLDALREGRAPKGDVLAAVRLAGIAGAKRTSELVPLCHAIPIDSVAIEITLLAPDHVRIAARARTHARTGVEMEALTAASVAALTLYDMLKAIDRAMTIETRLLEKRGGRSGDFVVSGAGHGGGARRRPRRAPG
jgi:cyclic pyranopterin phosphate synthase